MQCLLTQLMKPLGNKFVDDQLSCTDQEHLHMHRITQQSVLKCWKISGEG